MNSRFIDLLIPRKEDDPAIAAAIDRLMGHQSLGSCANGPAGEMLDPAEAFEQDGEVEPGRDLDQDAYDRWRASNPIT